MSELPEALREYLSADSLQPVWAALRERLERTGHSLNGKLTIEVGHDGADRLGGLLGRSVRPGSLTVVLAELDAALRRSAAGRGLVPVVAELTGAPLRDRPAERAAVATVRHQLWAELDAMLVEAGIADRDWVPAWTQSLRRSRLVSRLPAETGAIELASGVRAIAAVLAREPSPRSLGELATETTADAHGLNPGTPAGEITLRAVACAFDLARPESSAERRAMWERVGISTDEISGTVLVSSLRPPGADRWSAMMRDRADLGLITHLTTHELRRAGELTARNEVVHACENPQVLQQLAAAGVDRPIVCTSGNPSAAGTLLLDRVSVRYHGDFDWPGIAIARRLVRRGATPWRLASSDYLAAIERLPVTNRLPLTGRAEATPWDDELKKAMTASDVAVHEEAVIDILLADLIST
ncbi:MAG TPA: TIGR02679 family protein [Jatrophihabitans sp.]|jgi:uncharacterized protein (TIGR02679 family)|nr:TIGR02679 family protein [Jatrophihabitans sp.]